MGLKAGLHLLKQTGKTASKYIDDVGFGVRKWIKPTNFEGLRFAPELLDDTIHLNESQRFLNELKSKFKTSFVKINGKEYTKFDSSQMGSNPAFWCKNEETGELFYTKIARSEKQFGQLESEYIASKLYNLAGFKTPKVELVELENGVKGLISKYEPGLAKIEDLKSAQSGFAVDAWLANWDSLISGNTLNQQGVLVKLDNGGALRYRAMGEFKQNFGNKVEELLTLIDGRNKKATNAYGSMSINALINSFKKVTTISDNAIYEVVSDRELAQILINRRNYMTKVLEKIETIPAMEKNVYEYLKSITEKVELEDVINNKLFNISKIEVIPNPNKRALTVEESLSVMMKGTSRKMIMNLFKPDSDFALSNYSHPDKYIEAISKILEEHKGLSKDEYISILKKLSKTLEELATATAKELPLSDGMNEIGNTIYRYQAVQNIKDKEAILKRIIEKMETKNINNDETFTCYFERLYDEVKQITKKGPKVEYSAIDVPPEKIILSNAEKEEFKRLCLEKNSSFNNRLTPDMAYEEIADQWCALRVSDYVDNAESIGTPKMQMAALQTLPRYKGDVGVDGKVKPLVRWMHTCPETKPRNGSENNYEYYKLVGQEDLAQIEKRKLESYPKRLERWKTYDTDKWVDETFKVGETYSYPKMQSTSTSLTWSEGVFRDDNPGMNVKFIIHPRSKTSKAYYMGSKSLGDGEAVYLPDTKFTVLDKRVERAEDSVGNIFYRHIIEMQEL